ncbi:hypothetical protein HanPI659440_Chr06g0227581 [Helianthus annuus]|nr:hypothetical protein HanPI659440_Chr06g0227581 [Helianthus annuus]
MISGPVSASVRPTLRLRGYAIDMSGKHEVDLDTNIWKVYGVLDVQRVAGNFHISVHGLNIFVAQMGLTDYTTY